MLFFSEKENIKQCFYHDQPFNRPDYRLLIVPDSKSTLLKEVTPVSPKKKIKIHMTNNISCMAKETLYVHERV